MCFRDRSDPAGMGSRFAGSYLYAMRLLVLL